ncbi:MAG: hypothetical protein ACK5L6_04005 [Anaerorhabdus sp.]|uniref:hypothetical protein n=1 Tax=Anaerorhabdus sp. TaxID=1872524 RepID=UPI003A89C4A1
MFKILKVFLDAVCCFNMMGVFNTYAVEKTIDYINVNLTDEQIFFNKFEQKINGSDIVSHKEALFYYVDNKMYKRDSGTIYHIKNNKEIIIGYYFEEPVNIKSRLQLNQSPRSGIYYIESLSKILKPVNATESYIRSLIIGTFGLFVPSNFGAFLYVAHALIEGANMYAPTITLNYDKYGYSRCSIVMIFTNFGVYRSNGTRKNQTEYDPKWFGVPWNYSYPAACRTAANQYGY